MSASAKKRLGKELQEIQKANMPFFRNITVSDDNILHWEGLILPENKPYNKMAFMISLDFPAEYPFKPPRVTFLTKIYHPNVDDKGQVCLSLVNADNWKPAIKAEQIIQGLVALVNDPEPEHPLRAELAEEFTKNKAKFMKTAEEHSKKNGLPRP